MLRICCPWCGERDEVEFSYGGQAHVPYPERPADLSDAEWSEYLFVRDNPLGWFRERWVHSAGCRMWFNAIRHTVSYEFAAFYKPGDPIPEIDGEVAR
ncbi:MAG: sarcosine oxidase subunit delta [Propionibacteriales bacterium]|nr:sarcosine oxidase subunit delta [Propionibacteriales bacterium]